MIGGNLLGCASAHYIRRVLDTQREKNDPDDEIIIFEKEAALGGRKFSTLSFDGLEVVTGTAAGIDTESCPLFSSALTDANIVPVKALQSSWAFFDWDGDRTVLASTPSRCLASAANKLPFQIVFHALCALLTAKYVALWRAGLTPRTLLTDHDDVYATFVGGGFVLLIICGFGLIPFRWLSKLWNTALQTIFVNLNAKFNYGSSYYMAGTVANQFSEHLCAVEENDSCEGGITVGHILSRCGMAKYAKVGAAELFEKYYVQEQFREDFIAPELTYTYAESRYRPSHVANALATMLDMSSRLKIPTSLRSRARKLSTNQVKTVCPKLASAARASLQVCAEVVGIELDDSKYDLRIRNPQGEYTRSGFDAVIIATTLDAEKFSLDGVVDDVSFEIAQKSIEKESILYDGVASGNLLRRNNTARYMSIIRGELDPSYFRKSRASSLAIETIVLNALDCAQIVRLSDNIWRVLSSQRLDSTSELVIKLFKSTEKIVSWERAQRRYVASPMRDINGADVPAFILGKRLIYAAAIDRVANHVEIDCIGARNAASLFKTGNITWK